MIRARRTIPIGLIAVIAVGILGAVFPLLRSGFFVSDDGEWMVIRLSAFYQSLVAGQFPVRFLGRLNHSYGYPVANFLYPGYLYIGSILHVAGLPFVTAVKAILGLSIAGSGILMFATLRSRFGRWASAAGALGFLYAPYLLFDAYRRGSVGEVLAMFAATLTLFAVIRRTYWLTAPAVTLLVVSHNTAALFFVPVLLLVIAVREGTLNHLISILLGIGAAAFFWIPALLERRFVRFDATVISHPTEYFVRMENGVLLGAAAIVAFAILLRIRKRLERTDLLMVALAAGGMLMSLPVSGPIWQIPIVARLVQFPYRFLLVTVLSSPWVIALSVERLRGWHRYAVCIVFVLIWMVGMGMTYAQIEYVERPPGYYETNEGTTNVANEYMPRWVSVIPQIRPAETLEVISGDATLKQTLFSEKGIRTAIRSRGTSTIRINKLYYPGWGVTVDSILAPVDFHNPLGVMVVEVPDGDHVLAIQFRETPMRFAADTVSVACMVAYLIVIAKWALKS